MSDENREPEPDIRADVEVAETRSADTVFQGVQAFGELAAGLGALAIGASTLKKTFGGGGQDDQPSQKEPSSPPESK